MPNTVNFVAGVLAFSWINAQLVSIALQPKFDELGRRFDRKLNAIENKLDHRNFASPFLGIIALFLGIITLFLGFILIYVDTKGS